MRIILSGVAFKTSEPLGVYAEHRVQSWLGHLEGRLDLVTLQLVSEHRPEGQRVRCRLLARPAAEAGLVVDLIVEETSADIYEAIDRAPERMARVFERASRKERQPAPATV